MFNFLKRKKTNRVITLDLTEVVLKEKQREKVKKRKFLLNLFALGAGLSLAVMPLKTVKADEFSDGGSSKEKKAEIKVEQCYQALDDMVSLLRTKADVEYDNLSEEDKEKVHKFILFFFGRNFADVNKTKICREEVLKSMQIPFKLKDWGGVYYVATDPTKKLSSDKFKLLLFRDANVSTSFGAFEKSYDNDMFAPIIKKYFNGNLEVLIFWFNELRPGHSFNFEKLEKREDLKFCYASFVLFPTMFVASPDWGLRGARQYANKIVCPFVHLEKDLTPLLGEEELVKRKGPISGEQMNRIYYKRFYEVLRQTILWLDKEFGKKGRGMI